MVTVGGRSGHFLTVSPACRCWLRQSSAVANCAQPTTGGLPVRLTHQPARCSDPSTKAFFLWPLPSSSPPRGAGVFKVPCPQDGLLSGVQSLSSSLHSWPSFSSTAWSPVLPVHQAHRTPLFRAFSSARPDLTDPAGYGTELAGPHLHASEKIPDPHR